MKTAANIVWLGAIGTLLGTLMGCGPLTPEDILQGSGARPGHTQAPPTASGGSTFQTIRTSVGGTPATVDTVTQQDQCVGVSCGSCNVDLMRAAARSADGNWVGGDPGRRSDDPCGIQGAVYAYSDAGADAVPGNADDSLQIPAARPGSPTERENPCVGGKCCISGETTLWPRDSAGNYLYTTWGAGIALDLSSNGTVRLPYTGRAKGFKVALSGSLSGQAVRLGFTQTPTDEEAPYVTTTTLGEKAFMFTDPTCPSWSTNCIDPSENPYSLQVQVVGGDRGSDGPFLLCVDSIVPILSYDDL